MTAQDQEVREVLVYKEWDPTLNFSLSEDLIRLRRELSDITAFWKDEIGMLHFCSGYTPSIAEKVRELVEQGYELRYPQTRELTRLPFHLWFISLDRGQLNRNEKREFSALVASAN